MLINAIHSEELRASEQTIKARVELYRGSTLEKVCNCGEVLEKFAVEKTGEGKFFGFGFCQKLTASLIDIHDTINPELIDSIEASFGVGGDYVYPFPKFYIQELDRDEVFSTINITAYDALYGAAAHTIAELKLPTPYTIKNVAGAIAAALGLPLVIDTKAAASFNLSYPYGANFDGNETLRSVLDAIAEATQTIYYIDSNWNLYFRRVNGSDAVSLEINKNQYIELTESGSLQLTNIMHTTELGDNVDLGEDDEGETQYIRNNPFWENREDIGTLIDSAGAAIGGFAITQYRCDWVGNYLLELGDKVRIEKDNGTIFTTFVLDDNITYDGALWQVLSWTYSGSEAESASNPTSLGDALNMTFARVDKINKEITLLAQETDGLNKKVSQLVVDLDGIAGDVEDIQKTAEGQTKRLGELELTAEGFDTRITETESRATGIESRMSTIEQTSNDITARVSTVEQNYTTQGDIDSSISELTSELKLDSVSALLTFQNRVESNGVEQVNTTTGFKFDKDGLNISRTGAETNTQINEAGMVVSDSGGAAQLTATNEGVSARNLHATTYVFIGENSRLENYQSNRTACFWVGR